MESATIAERRDSMPARKAIVQAVGRRVMIRLILIEGKAK